MQCTKIKAKKKIFYQYILFSISPSQDPANHSAAQKSGAGSLLSTALNVEIFMTVQLIKYCKSQGNCACYFQPNTVFVSFTDSLYTVPSPVTHVCVHTQTGTHTHLENLLSFTNKLQKGSNTLQDSTELCPM